MADDSNPAPLDTPLNQLTVRHLLALGILGGDKDKGIPPFPLKLDPKDLQTLADLLAAALRPLAAAAPARKAVPRKAPAKKAPAKKASAKKAAAKKGPAKKAR